MAGLKLNHIYKVYQGGVKAVNDFSMEIEDKEFIVFVGPSGCGKSTTLRMIAGLEDISAGDLYIGENRVNDEEPRDRDIAMVFQNYALYPHMTVYDNIAFGLKMRKVSKEEIDKKVREAAEILGITEYLERKPKALSGGQRQRVALGRAIVRDPKVFLLDEPLSNLDAKLRTSMRAEISKLHKRIQTTFIYVTHDQVEAMTMGTRIVVMKDGFVQQIDTPSNLYQYPINKFVAGFIGTPQMNFFTGRLKEAGGRVYVTFEGTEVSLSAPTAVFAKADASYLKGLKPVIIGLRAEHISADPQAYACKAECTVTHKEDLGSDSLIYVDFGTDGKEVPAVVKSSSSAGIFAGDRITVSVDIARVHLFDAETEKTIAPHMPEEVVADCRVKGKKAELFGAKFDLPEGVEIPEGTYEARLPADAFKAGGEIKAEVKEKEDIGGTSVLTLKAGSRLFRVRGCEEGDAFGIDVKRLKLLKDGETVFGGVPDLNSFDCKLVKVRKTKEKEAHFELEIANARTICPDETARELISATGKRALKDELEIRFSPCDVIYAEGVRLDIEATYGYGGEKFYKVTAGGQSAVICAGECTEGKAEITFDFGKAAFYDKKTDIRIK